MLAKFKNGCYLEVEVIKDGDDKCYGYQVYDEDFDDLDFRTTEYRNMELYYPMNLIDYILEFCEPYDVDGDYVILEQETMEEYKEFLEEDPDGEWVLERQGTDNDDIRYYKTEEAARTIMLKEVNEEYEDYENVSIDECYCKVTDEEFFQCWTIYKEETFEHKKTEILHEINLEFDRIENGINQYVWELQDTDVIYHHVEKLRDLINELKEVI